MKRLVVFILSFILVVGTFPFAYAMEEIIADSGGTLLTIDDSELDDFSKDGDEKYEDEEMNEEEGNESNEELDENNLQEIPMIPLADVDATFIATTWIELKDAVDQAVDGDTIQVGSIQFEDVLIVNKSLTFQAIDNQATLTPVSTTQQMRHILVNGAEITLTFINVILDGNSEGGGIESDAEKLTLIDAVIQNCRYDNTYGLQNVRPGSIYLHEDCQLVLKGSSRVVNNYCNPNGYGGGIYGEDKTVIELEDTTVIQGNQANVGAGVWIGKEASLTVGKETQIIENISNGHGGGVRLGLLSEVIVYGSVSNNQANYSGGISFDSTGSVDTFMGCTITVDGGKVNANSNSAIGALMGLNSNVFKTTVNIQNGGEVCSNTSNYSATVHAHTINVINGKINENITQSHAPSLIDTVDFNFYDGEITKNEGQNVDQGKIWDNIVMGTTIYCANSFHMEGGVIAENKLTDVDDSIDFTYGTVYVHGTEVSITGGTFRDNEASYGGALAIRSRRELGDPVEDISVKIENAAFSGNKAAQNGGAIHFQPQLEENVEFLLKDCTFEKNESGFFSGALYLIVPESDIKIEACEFQENKGEYGGVLYSNCRMLTITGSSFTGNEANMGGVIYNDLNLEIDHTEIFNNKATGSGGAVYNRAYGTIDIKDGTQFIENNAESGGAIISANGAINILGNVLFRNNKAESGGAVYGWNVGEGSCTVKVDGGSSVVRFEENTADLQGGAIFMSSLRTITITNAAFSRNLAPKGLRWAVDDPTWPSDIVNILQQAATLYKDSIREVSSTEPFSNVYNNFDLNFPYGENEEGTTITLEYYQDHVTGQAIGTKILNSYIGAPLPENVTDYLDEFKPEGYESGILEGENSEVTAGLVLRIVYQLPITYGVTYHPNTQGDYSGTTVDPNSYAEGEKAYVVENGFAYEGYDFVSWNTAANGEGKDYSPGEEIIMDDNVTLYAQWKEKDIEKITITYKANGGRGNDYVDEVEVNANYTILSSEDVEFTRSGYTYQGWSLTQNASANSEYNPGIVIMPDTNLTLYAVWKSNSRGGGSTRVDVKVKVTFYWNYERQDNNVYALQTVDTGVQATMPLHPERVGYIFGGWYLDKDCNTMYDFEQTVTKNIELYAKWTLSGGVPPEEDPEEDKTTEEKREIETPLLNRNDHYAYIVGYNDGTVRPDNNITRGEVAAIFFRLLDDDVREAAYAKVNAFHDVNTGDWYNNTISTLANMQIVSGYEDGYFRPDSPITRAEVAAMIARFNDADPEQLGSFQDIAGHWAEHAILNSVALGWIHGYEDGTFRPNNNITRAEMMTLVNQVLGRHIEEDEQLVDGAIVWSDNPQNAWYYYEVMEATNSHYYEQNGKEQWTELRPMRDWAALQR